jgi:molybdate transport system ATP-binding protein
LRKYKGYGQDLYLFGVKKGSGENIWDIKKNIGFFNSND